MFDKDGREAERWGENREREKTQRRSGMSHQLGEMYEHTLKVAEV